MAGYSDEEILGEIRQMVPALPHLVRAEEAERLQPRLVEILERAEESECARSGGDASSGQYLGLSRRAR